MALWVSKQVNEAICIWQIWAKSQLHHSLLVRSDCLNSSLYLEILVWQADDRVWQAFIVLRSWLSSVKTFWKTWLGSCPPVYNTNIYTWQMATKPHAVHELWKCSITLWLPAVWPRPVAAVSRRSWSPPVSAPRADITGLMTFDWPVPPVDSCQTQHTHHLQNWSTSPSWATTIHVVMPIPHSAGYSHSASLIGSRTWAH